MVVVNDRKGESQGSSGASGRFRREPRGDPRGRPDFGVPCRTPSARVVRGCRTIVLPTQQPTLQINTRRLLSPGSVGRESRRSLAGVFGWVHLNAEPVRLSVRAAITETVTDWWLKRQTFISRGSGGWEVECQGAGRFGVWRQPSSWLAAGATASSYSGGGEGSHVSSSFCKALILPRVPHPMTSSNPNHHLKASPPNTSGTRASTSELGRGVGDGASIRLMATKEKLGFKLTQLLTESSSCDLSG